MRNILFIFFGLVLGTCFAQEPQLLDNDWYLHNLIIDGENNIPYGTNYTFEIDFYEFENEQFLYYGAGGLNTVWIDYVGGEQMFEITDMIGLAKNVCWNGNDACLIYEGIYQSFYEDQIGAVLSYEIQSEGGTLRLIVSTPQGDQAIYRTVVLNVNDLSNEKFRVHPNPVSDVLFISSERSTIQKVTIFNVSGQMTLEMIEITSQIDVSTLAPGIYFAEITSEEGRSVQKFIKE